LFQKSRMFPCGDKGAVRLGDGRILLGDNTGGGAVIMLPVKRWCVGVWISSESPCTYTCIHLTIRVLRSLLRKIQLLPYFPKCDYCLRRNGWGCFCITPPSTECMKTELVPRRVFRYRRLENVSVFFLQHWINAVPVYLNYNVWQNIFVSVFQQSSFPFVQSLTHFVCLTRNFDVTISELDVKIIEFDFTLAYFGWNLYFKV
jgi:hypothetical protein